MMDRNRVPSLTDSIESYAIKETETTTFSTNKSFLLMEFGLPMIAGFSHGGYKKFTSDVPTEFTIVRIPYSSSVKGEFSLNSDAASFSAEVSWF